MNSYVGLCFWIVLSLSCSFAQSQVLESQSSGSGSRIRRQAEEPKPKNILSFKDLQPIYNLADPVSEDYPIIFNIILFISIVLILAVIAICMSIATMDPGRDSLIYRVTSGQKYKKDN